MTQRRRSSVAAMAGFPVLPLAEGVLFPMQEEVFTFSMDDMPGLYEVIQPLNHDLCLVLAMREGPRTRIVADTVYTVGCLGQLSMIRLSEDKRSFIVQVQGLSRVRVKDIEGSNWAAYATIEDLPDPVPPSPLAKKLAARLRRDYQRWFSEYDPDFDDSALQLRTIKDPGELADFVAAQFHVAHPLRQEILELFDPEERLRRTLALMELEREMLTLHQSIHRQVQEKMEAGQRDYYLREQLRVLHKELDGAETNEIDEIADRIEKAGLPPHAHAQAIKELARLRRMNTASPEYNMVFSYLNLLLDLPWSAAAADCPDIATASAMLDEDHYGLTKVKKRILEFLAVRKLNPELKAPILALIGPPGVGKTSLGRSIARAMGRSFIRVSLGGVRDEAEIRGHRRTYIGAMPGRIIQNLRRSASNNPVFMLDEIDKLGSDYRGDPSFALLEALDPEQNNAFSDHYLEIPFDLSSALFVCTGNILDNIPSALRDRLEVIELPGYTIEEKRRIADQFLIPEALRDNGLTASGITFPEESIYHLIERYTREAGVRTLKRQIQAVVRGCAVKVATDTLPDTQRGVTPAHCEEFLGIPLYDQQQVEQQQGCGVAVGMAWTPTGGDIIFIESVRMPGKGELRLSGNLGEVMKESAAAALSFLRSSPGLLPATIDFSTIDIHLHLPAGAVAKDGPSAGVAILTSLASLLSQRKVRDGLAMTGEITLRGKVLPVGGVRDKLLAAHRAGIRTILLPLKNKPDIHDLPSDILADLTLCFVQDMHEVLAFSLASD